MELKEAIQLCKKKGIDLSVTTGVLGKSHYDLLSVEKDGDSVIVRYIKDVHKNLETDKTHSFVCSIQANLTGHSKVSNCRIDLGFCESEYSSIKNKIASDFIFAYIGSSEELAKMEQALLLDAFINKSVKGEAA